MKIIQTVELILLAIQLVTNPLVPIDALASAWEDAFVNKVL